MERTQEPEMIRTTVNGASCFVSTLTFGSVLNYWVFQLWAVHLFAFLFRLCASPPPAQGLGASQAGSAHLPFSHLLPEVHS